jgi:hypothetical protein
MGKKSGSGSKMNNPDKISDSLETFFWVKIIKFFDADPGSGMEKNRIRDSGWEKSDPGPTTLGPMIKTCPSYPSYYVSVPFCPLFITVRFMD